MAKYIIEGGRPLAGKTKLPGAKNAVTKVLIASLLSRESSFIENVPNILEIDLTVRLLESFGATIEKSIEKQTIRVGRGEGFNQRISPEEAGNNRMAILTVAPLLHAFGEVILPKNLGGDKIGPRPIDFHIDAYKRFGAVVEENEHEFIFRSDGLQGAEITLPFPSVSTTENILLAASLARGTTVIRGAAIEPEVMDLVLFLQKMGAIIDMQADRSLVIEGQKSLSGARHKILPDRITCASLGAMAIATGGKIEILDARQDHMLSFLNTLRRMDAPFEVNDTGIVFGSGKKEKLKPISLETQVHPGFMTDWQPPTVILMTQAEGLSVLHETVYENRLGYCHSLQDMGAQIQLDTRCLGGHPCRFHFKDYSHSCIVRGPTALHGTHVVVPDLRAGFSYMIAALCAKGESVIDRVEETERGYGKLDLLLTELGAKIRREE